MLIPSQFDICCCLNTVNVSVHADLGRPGKRVPQVGPFQVLQMH
jgi:hypothetical protein